MDDIYREYTDDEVEQFELLGRVWDNWHGWRQRAVRRIAPRLAKVLDDQAAYVTTAWLRAHREVQEMSRR